MLFIFVLHQPNLEDAYSEIFSFYVHSLGGDVSNEWVFCDFGGNTLKFWIVRSVNDDNDDLEIEKLGWGCGGFVGGVEC